MLGIVLAIAATFGWGLSAVFVRVGLQYMGTTAGTLVSLISGFLLTAVIALVVEPSELLGLSWVAVAWFALVGLFNFPLGRFFNFLSVARLGVAKSTPLLSTSPFFAMTVSVLFLGERLTVLTVIGTLFITAGVYVAVTDKGEPAA